MVSKHERGHASLTSSSEVHRRFESDIHEQVGKILWTDFQRLSVLPQSLQCRGANQSDGPLEISLVRTDLVHPFGLCIALPLLRFKH